MLPGFALNARVGAAGGPVTNVFADGGATNTANTGGGGSHTHSFTGTAINLAVQYVDVIIATKD
jgi:exopolysaccharide biosynthesis protein